MQYPTVHINGTSEDQLLEGYCDAMNALLDAIKKLEACSPNARDYYVNDGDINAACTEHANRVADLIAVRRDINKLAEHVAGLNDSNNDPDWADPGAGT